MLLILPPALWLALLGKVTLRQAALQQTKSPERWSVGAKLSRHVSTGLQEKAPTDVVTSLRRLAGLLGKMTQIPQHLELGHARISWAPFDHFLRSDGCDD
jgi:hypothetical protein